MTDDSKTDVYTRITNKIIAALEQGERPWLKPWNANSDAILRPLRHEGTPYSGINTVMLWMEAADKNYTSPYWMTYKQATAYGANVRKGEKGSLVVYANSVTKTEKNDAGEDVEKNIPFMKGYTVFSANQIDGLPDKFYVKPVLPTLDPMQRIEAVETFFRNTGATIKHGGNKAYYSEHSDHIQMPPFEFFKDRESYYATLAHEAGHWTKHPTRLDRDFGRKKWGDEGYAREELCAELSSAFLSVDLRLTPEPRDDHAHYLASWLKVLRDDKRAIFTAAAHAQKACEFLHGLQPQEPKPTAQITTLTAQPA